MVFDDRMATSPFATIATPAGDWGTGTVRSVALGNVDDDPALELAISRGDVSSTSLTYFMQDDPSTGFARHGSSGLGIDEARGTTELVAPFVVLLVVGARGGGRASFGLLAVSHRRVLAAGGVWFLALLVFSYVAAVAADRFVWLSIIVLAPVTALVIGQSRLQAKVLALVGRWLFGSAVSGTRPGERPPISPRDVEGR